VARCRPKNKQRVQACLQQPFNPAAFGCRQSTIQPRAFSSSFASFSSSLYLRNKEKKKMKLIK